MKLHEVLFAPCLSARPLFSCHRSIARASARASVAGPLLVCHWSARVVVAVLSLVCCWSVTRPSVRASVTRLSLVCHSSICSCVCHSSVTRPSARASVTRPSVPPSFLHRSSICSSIAHPSLIHLFVRLSLVCRSSLSLVSDGFVCSFVVGLSPRPSARVRVAAPWLVCHSSFTDPSLVMVVHPSARSSRVALPVAFLSAVLSPVCLLFCHQSVCSCLSRPSAARRWFVCSFVARPSVRVVVARLSVRVVHRSSV
mgnify:CR=1 FL=1